ncbi:rhomboid family intramembrane serine protease [Lederbergia lenta]|uniref:Serine peptidase n=1 Tax=Lederbergia lenta TaxID=1467 RepID=A0A2X4VM72_LEDLE|nr:rhomboid family intramembrane serine protease [Lederbergia lenta]MCM3112288.1 rhomboid family intramembrane serine protease [Lederbergia lenta]MEC2326508.1 rhomboid family intramembrane serine protease [Lederbergia lenta]SQI53247.1 serine peptidase [Lederbergia lenta]
MFVRTESFGQFLKSYPVISTIIAIQVILWLMMHAPFLSHNPIFELLAGVNVLITNGEYWRLITPIFMHVDFSHLFFNSFSLILFGPALERAAGKVYFLILYFACGIGANIATLFIQPPYYVHIGASGAIFGLFGVYIAVFLFNKELMPTQGRQVIIPIVVISVIMTFFQSGVNITGHIFGLISGILIGKLLVQLQKINFYKSY